METATPPADACRPLAVVREPINANWHNVTVPRGRTAAAAAAADSRENLVYISQGHVIQVAILTSGDRGAAADVPYFMLKYQGQSDSRRPGRSNVEATASSLHDR